MKHMMKFSIVLLLFANIFLFGDLQETTGIKISQNCNNHEFLQRTNYIPTFVDALKGQTIDRPNFILSGDSDSSIEIFGISGNRRIQFLPLQVSKLYPKLIAFNAFDCSINSIAKENFSGLKNLRILRLNDNQIEAIAVDVFSDLKLLEILKLDNNKIRWIHEDSFKNLAKLEWLWLEGNELTSLYPNAFDGLVSLKFLIMNRNQLKSLNDDQFSKNLKLEKIQLQKNKIQTLSDEIFDNLKNLKEVDLRGNSCIDRHYGFWLGRSKFLEAFGDNFKADVAENCTQSSST